jgi:hypothetical protein
MPPSPPGAGALDPALRRRALGQRLARRVHEIVDELLLAFGAGKLARMLGRKQEQQPAANDRQVGLHGVSGLVVADLIHDAHLQVVVTILRQQIHRERFHVHEDGRLLLDGRRAVPAGGLQREPGTTAGGGEDHGRDSDDEHLA